MMFNDLDIYVINLTKRTDRLTSIKQQLDKIGVNNYKIVKAIDGSSYQLSTSVTYDQLKNKNNPMGYITPGHIGLNLTYMTIFNWVLLLDYKRNVMIIEDDALFCDDFVNKYTMCYNTLPNDWDVFFTGVFNITKQNSSLVNNLIVKHFFPIYTHCVIYNWKAIPTISDCLSTLKKTIDIQMSDYLFWNKILNAYSTIEPLSTQGGFNSDCS